MACPLSEKLDKELHDILTNLPENFTIKDLEAPAMLSVILMYHANMPESAHALYSTDTTHQSNDHAKMSNVPHNPMPRNNPDHTDYTKEELKGAETYYNKYVETGDANYRQMARDELRHAEFFIRKMQGDTNPEEQRKLHSYSEWYKTLNQKLQ